MATQTFTTVMHPDDVTYQMARRDQIKELFKMDVPELRQQLKYLELREPIRDDHQLSPQLMRTLRHSPMIPNAVKSTSILDSTSGTTGNTLIRQDLEPTLYVLFVKEFPAFDAINKGPSNGLVHAATQITSPMNGMVMGGTLQGELGTVTYDASAFARATFPIGVFAIGRGVSIKELAAVRQGGAPYDPHNIEMGMGMVQLAQDVQYIMMQGNATTSGGTLTQEVGLYNAFGFDGFRSVTGSVGAYTGNNAVQIDIGSYNILESIQVGAAKVRNNGGHPKTLYCTIPFKQALDTEQQGNKRYNDDLVQIIPGVTVNQVQWADGQIRIIPIPGSTVGNYVRTSDNATVEDAYLVDDNMVTLRWLFSESFTVLQIPSGVDGVLSERWIVFCMFGLEQAAPVFQAKIRRIAS